MLSKSRGRDRSLPLSLCLSVAEIYVSLMEKLKWIKSIIVSIAPRWPLAFDFYSLFVSVISPFWFLCFITSFLYSLSASSCSVPTLHLSICLPHHVCSHPSNCSSLQSLPASFFVSGPSSTPHLVSSSPTVLERRSFLAQSDCLAAQTVGF